MIIDKSQYIAIYALICLSSIIVFFINTIILESDQNMILLLGTVVVITWLISLILLSYKNINEAIKYNFFGFLIVFGLFNLGIPLSNLFSYNNEYLDTNISKWYYTNYTISSFICVYLFLIGFLISIFIINKKNEVETITDKNRKGYKIIYMLYIFLVFFWIFLTKIVGGIGNYTEYAEGATNSSLFSVLFVFGNNLIGILFVILSTQIRYCKKILKFFILWAIFALSIGLRGEVFFPLMIAISNLVRFEIVKFNFIKIVVSSSLVLTLLSIIFVYRHGEVVEGTNISPLATISEMGGSLRPINETIKWINTNEFSLFLGETYWAPFERLLTKFVPFINRIPANQDFRLMNVAIFEKAGPYGYSIVAEAFVNFYYIGTFIVGLLSGLLIFYYDNSNRKNIYLLALVFSLFFHIRQSFVGAFGVFFMFISVVLIEKCISVYFEKRKQS